MLKTARLFASLLLLVSLCSCNKSPSEAIRKRDQLEAKAQEEAAKIAEDREHLAELQQEQREKVAADIASRTDAVEAKRAAILEQAAAEQARREGITAELKDFIDGLPLVRSLMTGEVYVPLGGKYVQPGFVLASPAGYSVTYTKKEGDYFWFTYDEDAFALTLRKPAGGLATVEMKPKKPLVEGFQIDQTLPEVPSAGIGSGSSASSRGLRVLKATYGADQTQRDVKDLVKSKLQNGRLDFRAGNGEMGGDPIFGHVKTFYIKYISNGRTVEKSFREGQHVSLP